MMNEDEIFSGLQSVVSTHFPKHGLLERNEKFKETLAEDSLAQLTLVVELENYFDIMLEEDFGADLVTVQDLISALVAKVQNP